MRRAIPFLATLTLLGGCFTLPPGPGPDLSTPYNTLSLLRDSYILLDPSYVYLILDDNFIFYFDDNDVGDTVNGYRIPIEGWGRGSEYRSTQNMFDDAERIEFDEFDLSILDPPEGATHYSSPPIHYRLRYYSVGGPSYSINGYAQFELEKQDDGWIITHWFDQKVGLYSWGWLKAWYRL